MRTRFILAAAAFTVAIGCSNDTSPSNSDEVGDTATTQPTEDAAQVGDADVAVIVDATVNDASSDMTEADSGTEEFDAGGPVDAPDMDATPLPDNSVTLVNGRLKLTSSAPADVADCDVDATVPCDDQDADGLVDAWEQLVLDSFSPTLVFDENEQLFDDPMSVVAAVGRVARGRRDDRVTVYMPILYDRDYGTCGSLTSHPGDSERVALQLLIEPDGPIVSRAYTAAHEGTPTDHSMTFTGDELLALEFDASDPLAVRWVVYPSKDKHATYATKAICEGVSPLPCFSESCGPDGQDAAQFTLQPVVANVGEPDAPLVDDLSALGFPGESAWSDQSFCGGHERNLTCPGAVRSKLTNDPFL